MDTLSTHGVAIIPSVLDEEECAQILSGAWDFFEHITQAWETPINRNDTTTWKQFYKLFPLHSMLIQHWGVGHAQVCWDVRQNKKIIDIFSKIWNCPAEDLLVSFDGLSFNLPPETTKRGWNRNNTWYHTDQSYLVNEFKCIQSFITGLDIRQYDATFSYIECSHLYQLEFKQHFDIKDKTDWYKLTKEQEQWYIDKGCKYRNVVCPKGSLVLWDSRTIHCGIEADRRRTEPNIRVVIYLCYLPRTKNEKDLKKKQKAFEECRTTTHYPTNVKLFAKNPRTYGQEMPVITPIEKPVLTPIGKRLAGF